jgi:uncharacterized surface protein with fasciclin (FAS1) repeats
MGQQVPYTSNGVIEADNGIVHVIDKVLVPHFMVI